MKFLSKKLNAGQLFCRGGVHLKRGYTAIYVQAPSANIFACFFYVCNVTFGRLKRKHLDAKRDGSVTANVMLCHVLMHVLSFFYKTYQFCGVEACLGFQRMQMR